MTPTIAFIGRGAIGNAMADNLLRAGKLDAAALFTHLTGEQPACR